MTAEARPGPVVVKLGSSSVIGRGGRLRRGVVSAVVGEVAALRAAGRPVVVVSSGAIACGAGVLGLGERAALRSIGDQQAAAAVGQGTLFRRWAELLGARDVRAAQVLLTERDFAERPSFVNARRALGRLLEWGVVPIVNENDTTATDEITFGDNDVLAAQVAVAVGAALLVVLTDTPGLFTADPGRDPTAALVSDVAADEMLTGSAEVAAAGGPAGGQGAGGMRSKVVAAATARAAGIPTVIAQATRPGVVVAAVAGEPVGTRVHAAPPGGAGAGGYRLWLRYAKPPRGRVVVDAGAARALAQAGASLLCVGIVAVEGRFAAGEAVAVVGPDGPVGRGISNLSDTELRRVRGRRSAEARALLGHDTDEAIHRDHFVLDTS